MSQDSFQILEQNQFFLVVYKPESLSVHNQSPSLSELLTANKKPLHFVNRLDRETSGLMVIAQRPELHNPLAQALQNGKKFYRALLRSPWKSEEKDLIWSWPLTDQAEGYKNPQGKSAERLNAETKVKIIQKNRYFTEVELELLTGRQHQIRKHSLLAGHPIVGDPRYNEKKYNMNIEKIYGNHRMLLHAEKIEFVFNGQFFQFCKTISLENFFKNSKV
jgi:23S rRNA-/tRNA-specific pseudouridylate synthase